MKPVVKHLAVALVALVVFAASLLFPRYTFLVSNSAVPVLYRCDRWTGQVSAAIRNYNTKEIIWREVETLPTWDETQPLSAEKFLEAP